MDQMSPSLSKRATFSLMAVLTATTPSPSFSQAYIFQAAHRYRQDWSLKYR